VTGAQESGPSHLARRRPLSLADRPIRTKLTLLLLPPVAALLALAAVLGLGAAAAGSEAEQARRLVTLGSVGADLAAGLQQERAAAGLVFARSSRADAVEAFRVQTVRTDAVQERFEALRAGLELPPGLAVPVSRLEEQLTGLSLLREQVRAGRDVTASVVLFRYRSLIASLVDFRAGLSQLPVDAVAANQLRAAASLSQAIEALGLLQGAVLPVLGSDDFSAAAQQQVVGAAAAHSESIETFRQVAPADWRTRLTAGAGAPSVVAGERLQAVAVNAQPNTPLDLDTGAAQWVTATSARMEQLHTVEREFDTELVAAVTAQRDAQRQEITVLGAAVLLCLMLLIAVGWWVTRSMTRPLRELTAGATELAASTLPTLVEQLTAGRTELASSALIARASKLLPVQGRDEIGAVTSAFNRVAGTAARLASVQAESRAAVAGIAEAIARRLQKQNGRVTQSLDDLERNEEDPRRLELLFRLDEKITTTRRLIGSLLVLAGGRAGLTTERAIAVADVVKAAISQVDGAYHRVQDADIVRDTSIVPEAAEELVHVLAELIDNAIRFSDAGTPVTVSGQRVGDLLHLQVSDLGVGIPQERLTALLANLHDFELTPDTAKHMGLAVVGRIAARLGLTVSLRSDAAHAGTRADVAVPAPLFEIGPHAGVFAGAPSRPAVTGPPVAHPPTPRAVDPAAAVTAVLPAPGSAVPVDVTMELPVSLQRNLPHGPVAGTPAHTPAPIFEQVSQGHPWFAAGDEQVGTPVVPQRWQQAAAAASRIAASPASETGIGADQRTANGLPVREPGRYLVPDAVVPVIPRQRDHAAARRGLSALSARARNRALSPSAERMGTP
jgi:signal transduction histidine kinase